MKTPDPKALRFAAEWLRHFDDTHDGGNDKATAAAVAEWLESQATAAEFRAVARKNGLPVSKLRQSVAKQRSATLA